MFVKISYTVFALFLSNIIFCQTVSTIDSLEIVQKIDDWNMAWKVKDHTLAAKWYSEDADFTNAFGFQMNGREAIEAYLSNVFQMKFVMAGDSEQTSLKLRPISSDAVLAISTIEREGQKNSKEEELGLRMTTHHRLFQKKGSWTIVAHLISDARSTINKSH